jgi:alpha-L-rhamnosidase
MLKQAAKALLLSVSLLSVTAYADELAEGFKSPPSSARPRVWWHWMNGNVTQDGIDKDLSWMQSVGIGGVQNFDAGLATPQIVKERLVYMTPPWKAVFKHAVETAEAKGLEFTIASSPGWSETGGPWVLPQNAMKKLVWGETLVEGGKPFSGKIAAPPTTTGLYQSVRAKDDLAALMGGAEAPAPKQAFGDVAVVAVPVIAAPLPQAQYSLADGTKLDGAVLSDDNMNAGVEVAIGDKDTPGTLNISYPAPVTIRSIQLFIPGMKPAFGDALTLPVLEMQTAQGWVKVAEVPAAMVPSHISFAPVTAQNFRVVLMPNPYPGKPGLGTPAPGAIVINILGGGNGKAVIADVRLSGETRLNMAETKAGYELTNDYYAIMEKSSAPAAITQQQVINLTGKLAPDGSLHWTPPAGTNWRIYHFGWSLTGTTNHPASPEATGLESDKYDAAAVRAYMEHYLAMYEAVVGKENIGKRGIRGFLTDSTEVGSSNWSAIVPSTFKARRGYDITPWLPAVAGEIIGSPAETEKFLYDFRQTLAELMAEAHYQTVAHVAHEHGLKLYGEALEDNRPVLGDDLAMRQYTDVPMAALWSYPKEGKPRPTLLGDMKGASSVAHIYGQNLTAAESMTSAFSPWAFAPHDLKRFIDLEFAYGINRPVVHTSVHQPLDDKVPGLSLMIFGQYFNRHEAWAGLAKAWVEYISRSAYMLQAGRNYADIAYFNGEEMPYTATFGNGAPADLPVRHAYDFVNADILKNVLHVEGGELVAKGGARYKALYLGGSSDTMTLATLKRIGELADAGIMVIGDKPRASPALGDDPAAFQTLADTIWGSGKITPKQNADAALEAHGLAADFAYSADKPAAVLFVHRKLADGDVYYLNNRQDIPLQLNAHFRVAGKAPQIWRAMDGSMQAASYSMNAGTTDVPLTLGAQEAVFVVFRQDTKALALHVPERHMVPLATLTAPWHIDFQPNRGAPPSKELAKLAPLNENADAGVRYFSGEATYTSSFTAPKAWHTHTPLWLDLGDIGDIAEVRVNGKLIGTAWFAPYRLDISAAVKRGANALSVRVADTWVNRLIGDKQPGAKPITFTAAPTYQPNAPLRPAGLLGPVTLYGEK